MKRYPCPDPCCRDLMRIVTLRDPAVGIVRVPICLSCAEVEPLPAPRSRLVAAPPVRAAA